MLDEEAWLRLPPIGLGTMRLRGAVCRSIVEAALSTGYRHVDTARRYDNEADVGAAIRRSSTPRDQIVVTTKLWHDELDAATVPRAMESSLTRLGLDHVDLVLVHWPSRSTPLDETMEALVALRERGLARHLGVANFPSSLFARVVDTPGLIGNQVEYHPYLRQDRVLAVAREHGLIVTAYCPLSRGGALLDHPLLVELGRAHGCTPAQIALRWLIQQDGVVAIPGSADPVHLRENLGALHVELPADAMDAIARLACDARVVDPPHAPAWDRPG